MIMLIQNIVQDRWLPVSFAIGILLVLSIPAAVVRAFGYQTITATELKALLPKEDVFLLDVHIPEQKHIPGTDAFIDYRKIRENADRLPPDKTTKIVVYCRSGNMSKKAALDLIDLGYSQVFDLIGGTKAFGP
jgi:rhodanese-related sulfurtransferase